MRRNVDYSAELVSNLLFWASSQMNGIVVTPVVLAMPQMIADILNLFVKQAAEKKISILSESDIHTLAYADKDMIQVVIRNLISNAIKFCRPGDTITIQCRRWRFCRDSRRRYGIDRKRCWKKYDVGERLLPMVR